MYDWLYRVLGFDKNHPFVSILHFIEKVETPRLESEAQLLCGRMSATRKKEVAVMLGQLTKALDNNDCAAFSKVAVQLLLGIRL